MINDKLLTIITVIFAFIIFHQILKRVIFPILIKKTTTEIEKNPKWITPKIREKYYGLSDVDIITAESSFMILPRFRLGKNNRIELLIPNNTSVDDIDEIAALALRGKISICYGLQTPNKPAYWLSIFCYMLDGGNIKQEDISWEKK